MIYGSVCSGVEAATVAWHPLGWKPAWFCEFDKFPSAVLAHHYPNVPNLHDMTKIEERAEYHDRAINLLVGGTPCQSFSIAGLRKGLDDDRGNLALKFCRILDEKRPRWFVWENVPGVLSSNKGRDFASILSAFRECGYGFAYRVLDAQYFGVAQRRRRVFVVGHVGDWRPAAAVLFERESLRGYPAPRRKTGQESTRSVAACITRNYGKQPDNSDTGQGPNLIPVPSHEPAVTLTARDYKGPLPEADLSTVISYAEDVAISLRAEGFDASEDGTGRQNLVCLQSGDDLAPTLTAPIQEKTIGTNGKRQDGSRTDKIPAVVFQSKASASNSMNPSEIAPALDVGKADGMAVFGFKAGQGAKAGGIGFAEEQSPTLTAAESGLNTAPTALIRSMVRRLTPRECERLQGFPDDYTLIPIKGGYAKDGPRYKAMGNSMAVPVMRWIGERIQMFEDMNK